MSGHGTGSVELLLDEAESASVARSTSSLRTM